MCQRVAFSHTMSNITCLLLSNHVTSHTITDLKGSNSLHSDYRKITFIYKNKPQYRKF